MYNPVTIALLYAVSILAILLLEELDKVDRLSREVRKIKAELALERRRNHVAPGDGNDRTTA